jgi:hypothetical protein
MIALTAQTTSNQRIANLFLEIALEEKHVFFISHKKHFAIKIPLVA